MNFRTTLLILIVLIAAAAAVVYLQQPTDAPPRSVAERAAGQGEALFSAVHAFNADDVASLAIAYPSGRSAVATRSDGAWRQTSPAHFELMPSHVRGVLEAAAGLRWVERFIPSPADASGTSAAAAASDALPSLDQISLAPPRAVLTIDWTDADGSQRSHIIRLGRAIGGRAYAQVNDDPHVYVVDADLVNRLLPEKLAAPLLSDWRIRTLDGPDADAVRRVLLRTGGQLSELVRVEGRWSFAAPHEDRVDPQAVSRLLGRLSSIQVNQFVVDDPADLADFGLTQPAIDLVVETAVPDAARADQPARADTDLAASPDEPGQPQQPEAAASQWTVRQAALRIGGPVDLEQTAFYALWQDHRHDGKGVFTLTADDVDGLRLSADDLRDPRLTPLAAADITAVEIQQPDAPPLALQRLPDGWRLADQPNTPLSADAVARLLAAIIDTRAIQFLAPDALSPEPLAVITLHAVGRAHPEELRVHTVAEHHNVPPDVQTDNQTDAQPDARPRRLVVRQREPLGRVAEAAALDPLFDSADALRTRMLLERSAEDLTRLMLRSPDVDLTLTRAPAADADEEEQADAPADPDWLVEPSDAAFDRLSIQAFLDALLPLRAERWLVDADPLPDDAVHITLQFRDQADHAVAIDPHTGQAAFDDATGFEISPALLDALRALLGRPSPDK